MQLTHHGLRVFRKALVSRGDHVYERLRIYIDDDRHFLCQGPKLHRLCKNLYTDKK